MKKLFIIGNWKSYKTREQVVAWLEEIKQLSVPEGREAIICAPFIYLSEMNNIIKSNNLPIKLAVQNISPFDEGAYTGEIYAKQAAQYVSYVLVGHSERRKYFHETNDDVIAKIHMILEANLTPILCVSDMQQMDYYLAKDSIIVDNAEKFIFVYEPPSAISGGGAFHPESPEAANENAGQISQKIGKKVITLYGGSVNPSNAASFFAQEHIDGGLPGQASLDAKSFIEMVEKA